MGELSDLLTKIHDKFTHKKEKDSEEELIHEDINFRDVSARYRMRRVMSEFF